MIESILFEKKKNQVKWLGEIRSFQFQDVWRYAYSVTHEII